MNRDCEIRLDAIEACNLILEFSHEFDFERFARDRKTQSSVLIIHEPSKKTEATRTFSLTRNRSFGF
ncbi:MAG: hypothetical protein SVX43_14150 [Cyanobacteriota bacterium]|nr:hypothetical protein [Cyanobacteriota bacterium]